MMLLLSRLKAEAYRLAFLAAQYTAVDNDGHTYDESVEVLSAQKQPTPAPIPALAPARTEMHGRDQGQPTL